MTEHSLVIDEPQRSNTWKNPNASAGRVVIVFDDYYDYAQIHDFVLPFGWSLNDLWRAVSESDDTLAVGFFDLPLEKDSEDLAKRLSTVQLWCDQIQGVITDRVILVDINRGETEESPAGVDVLEAIRLESAPRFSKGARIGILSVLGGIQRAFKEVSWLNEYKERTFFKRSQADGLSTELLRFIGGDDLERRLWPIGTDGTKKGAYIQWFHRDDTHPIMMHNIGDVRAAGTLRDGTNVYESAVLALKEYLTNAFGFPAPEHWFAPPEIDFLWEDLKHLVGSGAVAHVGEDSLRNLTLGNLVILVGVAAKSDAASLLNAICWSGENCTRQILPTQSKEQARLVAKVLAGRGGLFARLSRHDKSGAFLLREMALTGSYFSIDIDLNMSLQWKSDEGRLSLLDKVLKMGPVDGDTYSAFRSFLIESAVSTRGREAKCVLNLLAPQSGNCWKLEIRKCY